MAQRWATGHNTRHLVLCVKANFSLKRQIVLAIGNGEPKGENFSNTEKNDPKKKIRQFAANGHQATIGLHYYYYLIALRSIVKKFISSIWLVIYG